MIHSILRRVAAVTVFAALAAGCASEGPRPDGPGAGKPVTGGTATNKEVERRAIERWEFLIARKAEKAYDYLSPGFRATKPREEYAQEMNNRPVRWDKVFPYSQDCEKADVCTVGLQIDYKTRMPGLGKDVAGFGFVKETWIKTRGKWYLLPGATEPTGDK